MYRIIITSLLLFSFNSYATDCASSSIEDQWNKSSEVLLGRIIASKINGDRDESVSVEITIKIIEIFKGKFKSTIIKRTYSSFEHPGVYVGFTSLIFNNGNRHISTCSTLIQIGSGTIELPEFISYADRGDFPYANAIKNTLHLSGKSP